VGRSSEPLAGYWIDGGVHSPLRIIETPDGINGRDRVAISSTIAIRGSDLQPLERDHF
jgi:hypothetical protein